MNSRIETKVKAASTTAGAVSLVLWLLATYVFHGEVPDIAAGLVAAIVPAVVTFIAGYIASHTPRTPPGR